MKLRRLLSWVSMVLLIVATVSCNRVRQQMKPVSTGHPYELLVVMDGTTKSSAAGLCVNRLFSSFVPGLPQHEPAFKVSYVETGKFTEIYKGFRNILFADVNSQKYKKARLSVERNINASPQLVLFVEAPDDEALRDFISRNGERMLRLLNDNEVALAAADLQRTKNVLQSRAEQQFGCRMALLPELDVAKSNDEALWLSSNKTNAMNMCFFTMPYTTEGQFSVDTFLVRSREVLSRIVVGARPETRFNHVEASASGGVRSIGGHYSYEIRGLWEMENDIMGGPFVAQMCVDTLNSRILVVEGFVYSPRKKKKELVRRLEASFSTLVLPTDNKNRHLHKK